MRKIKFRGLRLDGKGWVYGDLKRENDNRWGGRRTYIWIDTDDCEEDGDYVEIDWQSIGQFTGLTDKNGVDVFEGDKLFVPYNFIGTQIVSFIGGSYNICAYNMDKCEVIGNIHQNK